jgi:hypothetical protein
MMNLGYNNYKKILKSSLYATGNVFHLSHLKTCNMA